MRTMGYLILALAAAVIVNFQTPSLAQETELSPGYVKENEKSDSKVSSQITEVIEKMSSMGMTRGEAARRDPSTLSTPLVKVNSSGMVEAYIYLDTLNSTNLATLKSHGVLIEITNEKYAIVQGWIPFGAIEEVASLGFVIRVKPPGYGKMRAGSATTQGDAVINAPDVRTMLGFDGTGVGIGVISDGVDSLIVSQTTGDLPADILIGTPGSGNEGIAMLEIIHDIAPGAQLAFSGGFSSSLAFINSINFLVNTAGVDIIVDDIGFLSEPYFEDGMVAQEAADAVAQGVVFVTSAGNAADEHYQGLYIDTDPSVNREPGDPAGLPADDHDFGLAAGQSSDTGWRFAVPPFSTVVAVLQWNDPFGGSSNDYDLFLTNVTAGGVAEDSSTAIQDGDDDPMEAVMASNSTPGFVEFALFVNRFSGNPRILEIYFIGPVIIVENQFNVPGDSVFGHAAVPGVLTVGAVPWFDPGFVEEFSSQGPVTISFPAPELRDKPEVVAPDGVSISGAGGFPTTFFGTSASAAHAAAVPALILQANPSLTPTQVVDAITSTATEINSGTSSSLFSKPFLAELAQLNDVSGFGLINAFEAVIAITPSPSPSPSPTPANSSSTQPSSSGSSGGGGGGCSLAAAQGTAPLSLPAYLIIPLLIALRTAIRGMRERRHRG